MPSRPSYNDRRRFDREFLALGGQIRYKRGTGEEVYWHPRVGRFITVNARRRDVTREMMKLKKRAEG